MANYPVQTVPRISRWGRAKYAIPSVYVANPHAAVKAGQPLARDAGSSLVRIAARTFGVVVACL